MYALQGAFHFFSHSYLMFSILTLKTLLMNLGVKYMIQIEEFMQTRRRKELGNESKEEKIRNDRKKVESIIDNSIIKKINFLLRS